jgi:hypothetical protein
VKLKWESAPAVAVVGNLNRSLFCLICCRGGGATWESGSCPDLERIGRAASPPRPREALGIGHDRAVRRRGLRGCELLAARQHCQCNGERSGCGQPTTARRGLATPLRHAAACDVRHRRMSERACQRFTAIRQLMLGPACARELSFQRLVHGRECGDQRQPVALSIHDFHRRSGCC